MFDGTHNNKDQQYILPEDCKDVSCPVAWEPGVCCSCQAVCAGCQGAGPG